MDPFLQQILTILGTVITCSGFWAWMQKRSDKKDFRTQMILGLGYAEIRRTGQEYICRGWITTDELRAFETYIYRPYKGLNGDGAGDQIWDTVRKLPLREITQDTLKEVCS